VPLLLRRAPAEWSLPAFAPLLAIPGAAPAYTAIAGQSSTWAGRAALGGLGWLWIVLAGNALVDPLASALTAVTFVLSAMLLPFLVRGLRLPLDLIAAAVWAGALYAALVGIEKLSGSAVSPREAAIGAASAGVLAVLAAAARRSREPEPVP
jgi:hypothetical protein